MPSFKSSSSLQTLFESRRLPKAYLFLLEGLLNINPSIRPSSERVLGAIREGRVSVFSDPSLLWAPTVTRGSSIPSGRTKQT